MCCVRVFGGVVQFGLFSRQIWLFISFAIYKVHYAQLQGAGCRAHVMGREEET